MVAPTLLFRVPPPAPPQLPFPTRRSSDLPADQVSVLSLRSVRPASSRKPLPPIVLGALRKVVPEPRWPPKVSVGGPLTLSLPGPTSVPLFWVSAAVVTSPPARTSAPFWIS